MKPIYIQSSWQILAKVYYGFVYQKYVVQILSCLQSFLFTAYLQPVSYITLDHPHEGP